MRLSDAARVGITVLVAALLLGVATFSLRGVFTGGNTYTRKVAFPNAQGIQEGAYVRVRGVDMGSVEDVTLGPDSRAILTLRIKDDYQITRHDAIRIISSPVGFNPPYVEIVPGGKKPYVEVRSAGSFLGIKPEPGERLRERQRGDRAPAAPGSEPLPGTGPPAAEEPITEDTILEGETGADTERLMARGEELLENLNELTVRMNRLTANLTEVAEDPALRRNLMRTASNFAKVSESSVVIARNMEVATARADRLISSFQATAAGLNRTLRQTDALMADFRSGAGEFRSTMRSTRALVADTRQVVKGAGGLVQNTNRTVEDLQGLVKDTREALGEGRPKLTQVLDSLNTSLRRLDATLEEAQTFLADPQLRGDLKATAENVKDATANLKKITEDVHGLTGDPKVQQDLRDTVVALRDAATEAGEVFRRVRGVLGGGGTAAEKVKSVGQRLSDTQLEAALVRQFRSNRTRLDFNATIPWSESTYYFLGLYDFGESNRINAQMGQQFRPGVWGRYGIYASTLGLGLDFGDRLRPPFSLNLFGVDDPQLDARGNIRLSPSLDLTIGLDDITGRADPLIGLRYRR